MPVVVLTTGRAAHGRQVKDDDPYYKGYPGPPGWGFGMGLTNTLKNKSLSRNLERD